MANNPTTLPYERLKPGYAPRFGVSDSPSEEFSSGSRYTLAWFSYQDDAERFAAGTSPKLKVWDLERGVLLK